MRWMLDSGCAAVLLLPAVLALVRVHRPERPALLGYAAGMPRSKRSRVRSNSRPARRPAPWAVHLDAVRERLGIALHGLTLTEIEACTGINHETARRQLAGLSTVSLELVLGVVIGLGISADWLVLGRGSMRASRAAASRPAPRARGPRLRRPA